MSHVASHSFSHAVSEGPLQLWVLGDGKPGHENQSLGLAEAMARLTPCSIHVVRVSPSDHWFSRTRSAVKLAANLPAPSFIFAAGHATHIPLCWLAKAHFATSVVLMKPSLPLACFGVCIAPEHDFPALQSRPNLITTRGAINRVLPGPPDRKGKLILIGGPSKTHGWDSLALLNQLAIITSEPGPWLLTDSRRTPPDFLAAAHTALPNVTICPHSTTPSGWVPSHLADSSEVWVTEDSVSMIYEALTSGARVGLLPCPRLKSHSRVLCGLDALIADGFLTSFDHWLDSRKLPHQPTPLREADRCAKLLLHRSVSGS